MEDLDSKVTLRLFIDPRNDKVVFAEAEKGFVDFIFSLLTLPLGFVTKVLSPLTMIGSFGKLYQSIEDLKESYFVANIDKSSLFQPNIFISDLASPLLLGTEAIKKPTYYLCDSCKRKITSVKNTLCPNCKQVMADEVDFVVSSACDSGSFSEAENEGKSAGGFVNEILYVITDDLEVRPASSRCVNDLMYRFDLFGEDAKPEMKVVSVGKKEGIALLKASLETNNVLTDVFSSAFKKKKALLALHDSTDWYIKFLA